MSLQTIYTRVTNDEVIHDVCAWYKGVIEGLDRTVAQPSIQVKGLSGSMPAFLLRRLHQEARSPLLCLTPDEEEAAYLQSDLEQFAGNDNPILRFPPTGLKPYDEEHMEDPAPFVQRTDVLHQLSEGYSGIIITSVEAIVEKVPSVDTQLRETTTLAIGTVFAPDSLAEKLVEQGFERAEFVEQPGDLAVRGGILDVFPFTGEYPIRIEFFGDEVDSLREFDPKTQRSISRLTTARIVPNLEHHHYPNHSFESVTFASFFEYLPDHTLVAAFDGGVFTERADDLFRRTESAYKSMLSRNDDSNTSPPANAAPEHFYIPGSQLEILLFRFPRMLLGSFVADTADQIHFVDAKPQPAFNGSINVLRRQLSINARQGIDTFILCDSRGQETRLFELLQEDVEAQRARLSVVSIHEGFEFLAAGVAVYTDHQIFDRYHRPTVRKRRRKYGGLSLKDIENLSPGDFVVHIDYGIGRFAGLHKITVRNTHQEAVKLIYQGEDVLYVNVNALYRLHKYSGKEGHQPRLTKLGSGQWEKTKSRTKKRVKDIARDLIKLYAKRKASPGFSFSRDSIWQREMEASFRYEDTPDQAATTEAVKDDMLQPVPMDRLVCGDVGFGKTEIAVRAAFKAVQDGKQVGILVPTTILAAQHLATFSDRLGKYPVVMEMLSRFRTSKQQKEIIQKLEQGSVDIIIGTHRIASKDIQFKDLGLLIIDEEQRFGVAVKERLRQLKAEVDTLTLTATPIPRTLQFSLMGARDLSIMNTPPPNRQPINTEIHTFDKDLIRDAILFETSRSGQVFFIYNRIQSIEETASMLRLIVPDVRFQIAHGQMNSRQLERVMMGFINKKFEVLISTNIIENGLDISNANTIIIDRADRFGLADLHQLRGRVGRSDRRAFCYLLVPSIHGLTREAKQRLQAVEELSDLGSGFGLAMRDMDIRGAGTLLGGEQSGFIDDVGYETYHRILDEAVVELREEEFNDVFEDDHIPTPNETTVDLQVDALIPTYYLSNNIERLNIYRRISEAKDEDTLEEIRLEMEDRFGPVPEEVDNLIWGAEIKILAQSLRLRRILIKNQRLFIYPPSKEDDPYFYDSIFYQFLEMISRLPHRYVLKDEKGKKFRIIVQDVPDLQTSKSILEAIQLKEEIAS